MSCWIAHTNISFPVLVPVNLKEQDAFHLTIEEYLLALISVVEELVSSHTLHLLLLCVFKSLIILGIGTVAPGRELGHPG